MSRRLVTEVYNRKIGCMSHKAVLAYMADRASDDGTGVYCSKTRIADEIECSRNTVIASIKSLTERGILLEVRKRKRTNGFVYEYAVSPKALLALPLAKTIEPIEDEADFNAALPEGDDTQLDLWLASEDRAKMAVNDAGSNAQNCALKCAATAHDMSTGLTLKCATTAHEPSLNQDLNQDLNPEAVENLFFRFWEAYPNAKHKVGKARCRTKFSELTTAGIDPEKLIKAATNYRRSNPDLKYVLGPFRWLSEQMFEDWVDAEGKAQSDKIALEQMHAEAIIENRRYIFERLSSDRIGYLIHKGLVTKEQCRAVQARF